MTPMHERGIASTPWAPLVDQRRIRTERILALLDRLARQSALYLFADGPRPTLSGADGRTLRPLLALPVWSRRERRSALRRLFERLRLTEPLPALDDSDVAVLVAKSTRPRWIDRLGASRTSRRSPVLAGARLLGIFEENAWSRPDLSLQIIAAIHANWRARTAFSPDEPDWPTGISAATLRLLVAAALTRPKQNFWTWLAGDSRARVLAGLDASLDGAIQRIANQSLIEQAIVLDAVTRHREQVPAEVRRAVARLPLAQTEPYAGRFGHVGMASPPPDVNAAPPDAAEDGHRLPPEYIIRLAEGRI